MAESELERAKRDPKTKVEAGVSLLLSGASFPDIAKMLEYKSAEHARLAVERALAAGVTLEDKDLLRKVQAGRYERLLKSVMPRATDPRDSHHLAYNARANALVDRISKLHGIDAPIQVQVTPSDEYLIAYANQMKASLGLDTNVVEEADIMEEAEIVTTKEIEAADKDA